MKIVLLGPPGVGKGTQGRRLTSERGWALISTGEVLRDAVARGTALGLQARQVMDAGQLVPDAIMIDLVRERTAQPDAVAGFVLDGFPCTVPQAEALERIMSERGQTIDMGVLLTAPQDELVRRLAVRRECPVCKRAYNVVTAPPRVEAHCDDHPEALLVQRADDEDETVHKRLAVYLEQTEPLVGYYRARGRLVEVVGVGSPGDVYSRMRQAMAVAVEGR